LREIRELGYQGSSNLPVRYINQGRAEGGRPHLSPRRAARILLTRPDRLTAGQHETLAGLTAAGPEMTALTSLITSFAALAGPRPRQGLCAGYDALLRLVLSNLAVLVRVIRHINVRFTMRNHNSGESPETPGVVTVPLASEEP